MKIKDISLKKIYESGQTFRWREVSPNRYIIPYGSGACEVVQTGNFEAQIVEQFGENQDWEHYFDLNRDYGKIDLELKKRYPKFKEAIDFAKGIRILNQSEFETLITFIFSANNNIKRIMNSVEGICKKYGRKIHPEGIYLFPEISEMVEIDEEEYRSFGAGYRASYLVDTVDYINHNKELFARFRKLDDKALLNSLEALKGVGPKVARCIALFAYSREEFPIDTWIKKAIKAEFNMPFVSDKQIAQKVEEYFKYHRGIIQ